MQATVFALRDGENHAGLQKKRLAKAYQDDIEVLVRDYEDLGKKFVSEAIDICQKSLKVFESLQAAAQKAKASHQRG